MFYDNDTDTKNINENNQIKVKRNFSIDQNELFEDNDNHNNESNDINEYDEELEREIELQSYKKIKRLKILNFDIYNLKELKNKYQELDIITESLDKKLNLIMENKINNKNKTKKENKNEKYYFLLSLRNNNYKKMILIFTEYERLFKLFIKNYGFNPKYMI